MTIPSDPASSPTNLQLIQQALSILTERGVPPGIVELRKPGPRGTQAGFFNNLDALAEEAARLDGTAPGLYVTLNPVNPQLLARAPNVVRAVRSGECTRDDDILEILWLPVDVDPVRPSNTSATDTELQHARDVRDALGGISRCSRVARSPAGAQRKRHPRTLSYKAPGHAALPQAVSASPPGVGQPL
jgi:hypothetical protein